eukprot:Nitzschia sp. Nitz4//scaffold113_size70149//19329//20846//NITZ4_005945-RA/size70149-processed-gene-0.65-mRNA-1//-1//CDS//3329533326//4694//frame0
MYCGLVGTKVLGTLPRKCFSLSSNAYRQWYTGRLGATTSLLRHGTSQRTNIASERHVGKFPQRTFSTNPPTDREALTARAQAKTKARQEMQDLMGKPLQVPVGPLGGPDVVDSDDEDNGSYRFIPEVPLYIGEGGTSRKRILILCTGGTLTMAPDPNQGGALVPVQGALTEYMKNMTELHQHGMPEYVLHEYVPGQDSSDLGPADWATIAKDIRDNYLHFDGFVVLSGTDTMAYCATALSFMLENLGKPVVFTGSQIPLCEPYNDARRNVVMAMIFASRVNINEVSIFFHDRLLRANRATKVDTHGLAAFNSPNMDPLATIGINIDENQHLVLPAPKGPLKVHTAMDTRLLTIRLVPGFDDQMLRLMLEGNLEGGHNLKTLVLQLYGTGNFPRVKDSFVQLLSDAVDRGVLVVATTQCLRGSVMLGTYATGRALQEAGVVSASDMTVEAVACKTAYLFGRQDLTVTQIGKLMSVPLRGEVTSPENVALPPLSSDYQRGMRGSGFH